MTTDAGADATRAARVHAMGFPNELAEMTVA